MHICKIMRDNISMDRQNTLKRDNAYNMKHSSLKMNVLSLFSFNMKYLTRTGVHVQVGYYMGSAIEIPKVHYSKVMVHLYEILCEHLLTITMRIIICFKFHYMRLLYYYYKIKAQIYLPLSASSLNLYLPICISPDIRKFHHLFAISTTSFHSFIMKFFLPLMHTNLTMMSSLFKHLKELNTCDKYSTFILNNNGIDETRN